LSTDIIIDPDWTLEQAYMQALRAYPGDNIGVKGYRNWVLKAWASTVGRERAVRELAEYRAMFPSKRAAAAAMGISADTFRKLEKHFARVRRVEGEGLTLFLSNRLIPWDQTMLHAFVCSVLGTDTDVAVAEYAQSAGGTSSRVRLVGGSYEDLMAVAEHMAGVSWRTQQRAALQSADLLQVPTMLDTLDQLRASVQRMELREQEREDREGAARDIAEVRKQTWASEPLEAMANQVARATGAPGLVRAGMELGGRAVRAMEQANTDKAVRRLEATLARHELLED
jgi:hypothetical protein